MSQIWIFTKYAISSVKTGEKCFNETAFTHDSAALAKSCAIRSLYLGKEN